MRTERGLMALGWVAALVLAGQLAPGLQDGAVAPARLRVLVIADGVEPAPRARFDRALALAGADALPEPDTARVRAELAARGVECASDATGCLARLAVLADVERAVRVWPAEGALDVLVVDATPRRARARLRERDAEEGWQEALRAALALADLPVEWPDTAAADVGASEPVPARGAQAAAPPAPERGFGLQSVAGAVMIGVGAASVALASALGVWAGQSIAAAEAAHYQDDAVAYAQEANVRIGLGLGALTLGALAVGAGVFAIARDAAPEGA